MEATRRKWNKQEDEDDADDETDQLLQQAIDMAVQQGRGWAPGEKEEYMKRILDDDFIPPMFCNTQEELEKSGLASAFAALQYDEDPAVTMQECKQKATNAFLDGKRNQVNNVQYFRDAVNYYYEAAAWANKIESVENQEAHVKPTVGKVNGEKMGKCLSDKENNESTQKESTQCQNSFTEQELDEIKSTLYANAALCHLQLKNWGFVKQDSEKALVHNSKNIKAWYRLAKAHQMLQNWEEAGKAIDSGLDIDPDNKDLTKLLTQLQEKIRKAKLARQRRERIRAERVSSIKQVWKHCQGKESPDGKTIKLGRVALVASVSDDDDYENGVGAETMESRWHHHFPHTGVIPSRLPDSGLWAWPCLFLYPSHSQSDFVKHFVEEEMLAARLAEMFPEVEDGEETAMPWDYKNEFRCSELAVYFEVNCPEELRKHDKSGKIISSTLVHPDSVEQLQDQASAMRFFEASRALKGDEGPEMANLAKAVERKRLHKQRVAWKKHNGSLWATPDPCPVVRVHPAMTLRDILTDPRMVVANFVVTLVVIPENHPAHGNYLKDHKCIGVLQPNDSQS